MNLDLFLLAQDSLDKSKLGPASNAILWPDTPPEDEDSDDEDNVENYTNQRFMRMGKVVSLVVRKMYADDLNSRWYPVLRRL